MIQTSGPPKTAVVLGKGTLAIRIADWFTRAPGYRLLCVVPVVPEPTWTDSLSEWADSADVTCISSGAYGDIPGIDDDQSPKLDLAISVTYDRIIAPWFINRCGRILNIHNSPLPRYRGVSPINWALKNGERMHGVTIHEITAGIDDGPIVSQLLYSIYPEFDEVVDVYLRGIEYGWVLFQQTAPILDRIEAVPQDGSQASYYARRDDEKLHERRSFTREESVSQRR